MPLYRNIGCFRMEFTNSRAYTPPFAYKESGKKVVSFSDDMLNIMHAALSKESIFLKNFTIYINKGTYKDLLWY